LSFSYRSNLQALVTVLVAGLVLTGCGQPDKSAAPQVPMPEGILAAEAGWQIVGEGYVFTDGPAVRADGVVFYTDVTNWRIYRENPDGSLTEFADDTGGAQGMMFGPDGRLYVCRNKYGELVVYNEDGSYDVLLAGEPVEVMGNPTAEPEFCNDVVVTSKGLIYYSDRANRQVRLLRPGAAEAEVVASGYRPNGIIMSPDESRLYTTDSLTPRLVAFDVQEDGTLVEIENFFDPILTTTDLQGEKVDAGRPGTNGMTVDAEGRVYVSSFVGIQVFSADGRFLGSIPWPSGFVSNLTFGGPEFDTLYTTGVQKVYKTQTLTKGAPYFLNAE